LCGFDEHNGAILDDDMQDISSSALLSEESSLESSLAQTPSVTSHSSNSNQHGCLPGTVEDASHAERLLGFPYNARIVTRDLAEIGAAEPRRAVTLRILKLRLWVLHPCKER
jgi:hypothetical protein